MTDDAKGAPTGLGKVAGTLSFFASCIRSGESWDDTCQQAHDRAIATLDSLTAENAALRKRLEVVPGFSESADGISCRDETIKQQDERINSLTAENAKLLDCVRAADAMYAHEDGAGFIDAMERYDTARRALDKP